MPTVLRHGPYRFFFYSADRGEPPHVHVERGEHEAKFWLDAVISLVYGGGFRQNEITEIRKLIGDHRTQILRKWHEHFSR